MIGSLLVANRGEIARRIFRTCHELGITTVAVYSNPDSQAAHAWEADLGVCLPGATPFETYLRADLIIEAALASGADAIHPGYGFLSENADFARAVSAAGLIWVGPPPAAIEAMASKLNARALASSLGIPVLDGEQFPPTVNASADERHTGERFPPALNASADERQASERFPLIVKASAGGGGRGMRVVRTASELDAAIAAATAEALSAFGDGTVFTEPYLESAHHIEVQLLADTYGTIWALGERECSIQRRHQKVIEETPSPSVSAPLRARLLAAAEAVARAVSYVGAGTVEFLVSGDEFYFLEMNTRLQVEHPVTEAVYRLDLVALQLDIANGLPLPTSPPTPTGHAIEARLYAEHRDFTPASGPVYRLEFPGAIQVVRRQTSDDHFNVTPGRDANSPGGTQADSDHTPGAIWVDSVHSPGGIRVDSGYAPGGFVSVHYDAMLAKVIAHAPTRAAAASKLAGVLRGARLHGIPTNRDLLVETLRHPAFLDGTANTGFLETFAAQASAVDPRLAMLAAALSQPVGWRNVYSQRATRHFDAGQVSFRLDRNGLVAQGLPGVRLVSASPSLVVLNVSGVHRKFGIATYGDLVCVDHATGFAALTRLPRFTEPTELATSGTLTAPMPGIVTEILVAPGSPVTAGQPLIRLEAMKMQHTVTAPCAGMVSQLIVQIGQQVDAGAPLITVSEES